MNKSMEPLYVPDQDIANNFSNKNVNEFKYNDEDQMKQFDGQLRSA